MGVVETGAAAVGSWLSGRAFDITGSLFQVDRLREPLVRGAGSLLERYAADGDGRGRSGPGRMTRERALVASAILDTFDRLLSKRYVSPHVVRIIGELWARALLVRPGRTAAGRRFVEQYGCEPPWFIVVSPGHACNLGCAGCYACSSPDGARLSWTLLDRVVSEARELWGIPLVVISGGEPLAYRSGGNGVLDLVERHPECLFLMFTNGTLLDRETVSRLASLGNLTPALSVEGLREGTDASRGSGVFDSVLGAMADLREAGVPFGVSATATRYNSAEILSDEFIDLFFNELGCFYGFFFHYMPIGRDRDLDLMPSPQQRMEFWRRSWELIERRKVFIFDFWNFGTLVNGCVSAGRERGYMYIDWNGKVMPCVFAPYSVGNVHDLYARGGTLNDLWESPFLAEIRGWQREYGYGKGSPSREGNLLCPCPVRDHYPLFRRWVELHGAEPEDEDAGEALSDEDYYMGLAAYGEEMAELSRGTWESEYIGDTAPGFSGPEPVRRTGKRDTSPRTGRIGHRWHREYRASGST